MGKILRIACNSCEIVALINNYVEFNFSNQESLWIFFFITWLFCNRTGIMVLFQSKLNMFFLAQDCFQVLLHHQLFFCDGSCLDSFLQSSLCSKLPNSRDRNQQKKNFNNAHALENSKGLKNVQEKYFIFLFLMEIVPLLLKKSKAVKTICKKMKSIKLEGRTLISLPEASVEIQLH